MSLPLHAFSKEEGLNIIVSDTLLYEPALPTRNDGIQHTFFELKKLKEKNLKLHLHIVSMSDYWREGIIPRGLRISKFPSFPTSDTDFKDKWEAVLNKCSMDLILLLIQQAKKEKAINEDLIHTFEESLRQTEVEVATPYRQRIQAGLDQLERSIKALKIKKMQRDQGDYSRRQVYKWVHTSGPRFTHSTRPAFASFSAADSSSNSSLLPSASSASFSEEDWPSLGARSKTTGRREEGGGRNTRHRSGSHHDRNRAHTQPTRTGLRSRPTDLT